MRPKHETVAISSKITKLLRPLIFDFKEAFKQIDNLLFVFRQTRTTNFLDIYVHTKILKCKILSHKLISDFNNRKGIAFTKPLICSNNELFKNINKEEFKTDGLKRVINFYTESDRERELLRVRGFSVLIEDGICSRVKLRSLGPSIDLEIVEILDAKE